MTIYDWAKIVGSIKPGERLNVSMNELRLLLPMLISFTIPDMILENIVGSSYEFSYFHDYQNRAVVFCRSKEPLADGTRSYVSPDRRHLFDHLPDGTWRPKNS